MTTGLLLATDGRLLLIFERCNSAGRRRSAMSRQRSGENCKANRDEWSRKQNDEAREPGGAARADRRRPPRCLRRRWIPRQWGIFPVLSGGVPVLDWDHARLSGAVDGAASDGRELGSGDSADPGSR